MFPIGRTIISDLIRYLNWIKYVYQSAEAESSDDRVLDGDGGEVESADLAGEDLSDGA